MCFWRRCLAKRRSDICYPKGILPNVEYALKIDIDDLLDKVGNFVVSRRIEGSVDDNIDLFAGQRRLRIEALGSIPNMSLNLLGGRFIEKKHTKFRQLNEAANDWDGKEVLIEDYDGKYEALNNCAAVSFRGKNLHRIAVPYKKKITDKGEMEKLRRLGIDLDRFSDNNDVNLQGVIKLEHKPTMLNYWHLVMDIFPSASEVPIKRADATWKKNIVSFVTQEILTVKFEVNPKPIPRIRKRLYSRDVQ